jgi:hypothetical protein
MTTKRALGLELVEIAASYEEALYLNCDKPVHTELDCDEDGDGTFIVLPIGSVDEVWELLGEGYRERNPEFVAEDFTWGIYKLIVGGTV